ncbi:unnamed protein product [Chrysoparadoxa australica]
MRRVLHHLACLAVLLLLVVPSTALRWPGRGNNGLGKGGGGSGQGRDRDAISSSMRSVDDLLKKLVEMDGKGETEGTIPLLQEALEREKRGGSSYVVGALSHALGMRLGRLGRWAAAEEHLRVALENLSKAGVGEPGSRMNEQVNMKRFICSTTLQTLGACLAQQGRHAAATEVYDEVIRQLVNSEGGSAGLQRDSMRLAMVREAAGLELMKQGKFEQAQAELELALQQHSALLPEPRNLASAANSAEAVDAVLFAELKLAAVLVAATKADEAQNLLLEVLEMLGERADKLGEPLRDRAISVYMLLGQALELQGRYAEAQQSMWQGLTSLQESEELKKLPVMTALLSPVAQMMQLHGAHIDKASSSMMDVLLKSSLLKEHKQLGDKNPMYAQSLSNVAMASHQSGKNREAEKLLRQALNITTLEGEAAPGRADVLLRLGTLLSQGGGHTEGRGMLEKALELQTRSDVNAMPMAAASLVGIARCLLSEGRPADAEEVVDRATALQDSMYGEGNLRSMMTNSLKIACYQLQGRREEAEKEARSFLSCLEGRQGFVRARVAAKGALGSLLASDDRDHEAVPLLMEALQEAGGDSVESVLAMITLAGCMLRTDQCAEAEALCRQSLDSPGCRDQERVLALNMLSAACRALEREEEALEAGRGALELARKVFGPDDFRTGKLAASLATLLEGMPGGGGTEAVDLRREAEEIAQKYEDRFDQDPE